MISVLRWGCSSKFIIVKTSYVRNDLPLVLFSFVFLVSPVRAACSSACLRTIRSCSRRISWKAKKTNDWVANSTNSYIKCNSHCFFRFVNICGRYSIFDLIFFWDGIIIEYPWTICSIAKTNCIRTNKCLQLFTIGHEISSSESSRMYAFLSNFDQYSYCNSFGWTLLMTRFSSANRIAYLTFFICY